MSVLFSATAVTWGLNFVISFSWPSLVAAFGDTGAFSWYGAWNIFGWVVCYFFLPETKNLTLEELDNVFSLRNRDHALYYLQKLPWYVKKYLLFQDVEPVPPLYSFDQSSPSASKPEVVTTSHNEDTTVQ